MIDIIFENFRQMVIDKLAIQVTTDSNLEKILGLLNPINFII